ncbi:hypothetical protein VC306_23840 [Citrobacter portucalensis]|uniref:hypothetical protein n=1 Tax=Citrobacter TaxID=544 RepID=UPI00044B70E0|nr:MULTISPECIES: hypothetical protein [Citrobacter]ETX66132.1 hypothetical protein P835_00014 [Citrobacter portucalensis]MDE9706163.1 hypothetical protein [Citrobacter portucalensis]MDM2857103.1 hypothetical protein [Citrobacter sp. Cpo071]MDX6977086.1 hypothetical protein [Citrobacter portucalensis]MEB2769170.1 hypothetical protein [Citrobacter portucalensis]
MDTQIEAAISKLSAKKIKREDALVIVEEVRDFLPDAPKKRKKLLKEIIDLVFLSIKNKNRLYSLGGVRFVFLSNLGDALEEIKIKGIFRCSNYNYQTSIIKELIYDICKFIEFEKKDMEYFGSVLGLIALSSDIRSNQVKVIAAIKSRPSFLKTALALAESKFQDLFFNPSFERGSRFDEVYTYSKEAWLSSISFAINLYFEVNGNAILSDLKYIDENISSDYYREIFLKCFQIQDFKEAEIKVDFFDYKLIFDEEKKIFWLENDSFEKAKSYGYTKTDLRLLSLSMGLAKNERIVSFYEVMEKLWSEFSKDEENPLYALPKDPIERITIRAYIFDYDNDFNFFGDDRLFKEEAAMLVALENENYSPLLNKKILGEITVLDIFKIQRFFYFLGFLYKKIYEKLKEERPNDAATIRLRSLLPVISETEISNIFTRVTGHEHEECLNLINILSAKFPSTSGFTDLQYTPIVKIENSYLILPLVLATSNLVRSIALSNNVHLSITDTRDSMVEGVTSALSLKDFLVYKEVTFGQSEIDIVAFKDGELFLFECKNPYHPVNDYELRNTYSQLKKGFYQMKKIRESLLDKNNLKVFCNKISLKISSVKNIHYSVINANRALLGYEDSGVRVLHANELMNFINNGTISSQVEVLRSWKDDSFHVSDLVRFITGDVITKDFDDYFMITSYLHNLRSNTLVFKQIAFDLEKINNMSQVKYKKIN